EEPVSDEFFFHVEYLMQAELLPLWLPAIRENDTDPRFRVSSSISPGEQIRFVLRIGVQRSAQQGNEPIFIRAVVDSCLDEPELPAPPCRIIEPNEDDNVSDAFDLPFVVVIK
ncbi:MAG: hypothetical protein ABFR53_07050, partial [Actinomycetota bacterium]